MTTPRRRPSPRRCAPSWKQLKCEIRNHPRCGVLIEISRYDPFNVDMVEMFTRGWVASALHTPRLPSIRMRLDLTELEQQCISALRIRTSMDRAAPGKYTPLIFFVGDDEQLEKVRAQNKKNREELDHARAESERLITEVLATGSTSAEWLVEAIDHLEYHGESLCGHHKRHYNYDKPCPYIEDCYACKSLQQIKTATGFVPEVWDCPECNLRFLKNSDAVQHEHERHH